MVDSSDQKYIDIVKNINYKSLVYYPKTNFINIIRLLSVIYPKEKSKNGLKIRYMEIC